MSPQPRFCIPQVILTPADENAAQAVLVTCRPLPRPGSPSHPWSRSSCAHAPAQPQSQSQRRPRPRTTPLVQLNMTDPSLVHLQSALAMAGVGTMRARDAPRPSPNPGPGSRSDRPMARCGPSMQEQERKRRQEQALAQECSLLDQKVREYDAEHHVPVRVQPATQVLRGQARRAKWPQLKRGGGAGGLATRFGMGSGSSRRAAEWGCSQG